MSKLIAKTITLSLIDINQPIELEQKLFATDENKVSYFTPDSLESKFLAEKKHR